LPNSSATAPRRNLTLLRRFAHTQKLGAKSYVSPLKISKNYFLKF
jgi:hypothetical protein